MGMAESLLKWARECIQADKRGYLVWMSQRSFPGGWSKRPLVACCYGFKVAQNLYPPAKNKNISPEADDAYLLGHQLCRDLREDGPMHPIGKETGNPNKLSREEVQALMHVWFIEMREIALEPEAKSRRPDEGLAEELSKLDNEPEELSDKASGWERREPG